VHDFNITQRRFNTLMIAGIALPILLYVLLNTIFLHGVTDYHYMLLFSRIIIWIVLLILFLFAKYGECQPFLLLPHEQRSFWWYALQVFILLLLSFACGLTAAIPKFFGVHESDLVKIKLLLVMHQYPWLRILTCVTAGITEELIFRGYILSRLTLLVKGKYWPLVISALIFGFIHITYRSLSELIFAFSIGLIYGYHYQKYHNIYPVMIAHILVDLMATGIKR